MSIPHLFRCPISLDLFTDPVTLSTGQTYDRPSIEKWLAGGNLTCPVTMQHLSDTSLVPNHTLRHLIDQWLLVGPGHKTANRATTTCLPFATLKHNLQSSDTTIATKLETLEKVRIVAAESDTGQACLIQLGFLPVLLQLLFQTPQIYNSEHIELVLDCILSLLPSSHLDSLNMLKKDSNLASLVLLLDKGNIKIKTRLFHLLEAIATSAVTQELCLILGQTQRVLQVLVSLLLRNKSEAQALEAALRAICGICLLEANRANVVRQGGIDGLIAYLSDATRSNASCALSTLEVLAGSETGKKALVKNRNAIGVLVKQVFRVSSTHVGSEHAVGSLLIICCESPRMRLEAVNAGVLTQLLLLLQSQCSTKAKSKARALLKLLRSMWGDVPGGCNFYNAM